MKYGMKPQKKTSSKSHINGINKGQSLKPANNQQAVAPVSVVEAVVVDESVPLPGEEKKEELVPIRDLPRGARFMVRHAQNPDRWVELEKLTDDSVCPPGLPNLRRVCLPSCLVKPLNKS